MAADFSLQDLWWLKPKEQDNPLPALQLGVRIAENKANFDLHERQLANQIARTSLVREELLFKQKLQTSMMQGNTAIAGAISGVTDWTDPEQVQRVYEVGAQYPMVVGSKAWQGAEYMQRNAITARRLEEEAQSRIAARNRQSEMAANMGWVYPEDGSPPYLVDAKGGTHFAPFHAGLEAGFTPEKTNVGGVDLIHVSPNKWQVVNRPVPEGKLTDLEREDLRFVRKRRQELVDSLPTDVPKTGMFGGNKEAVAKYNATTNEIAQLTAKEEAIHKSVMSRGQATPSAPAAPKVEREGVKTEDRSTNAPPAVVAPADSTIRRQGGNLFQQQPDGTWKFIGPAQ